MATVFVFCAAGAVTLGSFAADDPFVGTWEGTFSSRNYASFPVTLVITKDLDARLAGAVTLASPCLRNADLEVTIQDSRIVLAGTDAEGDTITFRGSLDSTGARLAATYVLNGSASGRCETDDGAGTLTKK